LLPKRKRTRPGVSDQRNIQCYANPQSHGYRYLDGNTIADTYGNGDVHADSNADNHCHVDADGHSHSDHNTYSNGNSNSYRYEHCDAAYPDSKAVSDASASPESIT
jgi:hypothetical protein